jgi:regulator of protease activity HflC (stomatin/prohibitin superfamily)
MLAFMKARPTTYVIHYQRGRAKREGAGLAFVYYSPTSSIVAVPVGSADLPFAFTELTRDFQTVTIQGQLTYQVTDPRRLAGVLDFSLDRRGQHASDDPQKLGERLVNAAQIQAHAVVQRLTLREALVSTDAIVAQVLGGLRASESVQMLGVTILGVTIIAVKPTPEMGRALEAEAREGLQRQSDEAIYARRNAAVEQERRIKESELQTEIAVQEKQRQIRETRMAADIAVEQQRSSLLVKKAENDRVEADSRAYALTATLAPVRDLDWRTLLAVSAGGTDPKLMIALAFREMAENAGKIGSLSITPDLLSQLIAPQPIASVPAIPAATGAERKGGK